MEKVIIKASDGYNLNVHVFDVSKPKGFIQIIHGMEEHQERYELLASELNNAGYSVITSNLRGHGDDAPCLGYFADKDGYKLVLEDEKLITDYILNKYGVGKIILFGHSMGTIIARDLMMSESNVYEKVILSGYPNPQPAAGAGIMLANIVQKFKGPQYFSKFLEGMAVGAFNKAVRNPNTDFDWLSYNEDNVDAYIKDPYCGHGFKVSALRDLFILIKNMANPVGYNDVNEKLPIFMFSGEDDPCTGGEKGREASLKVLQAAGFKNIEVKVYEKMRHETLNEKKRDIIVKDIIEFLG